MIWLSGGDFEAEVLMKKTRRLRQIAFELMSSECDSRLVGKDLELLP